MRTVDDHDFLTGTRTGYDRTAGRYAERFHTHLDDKPLDRAMLGAFAELVAATDNKQVIDVGCGTGATTKILHDHGVEAFGIDLSPKMIDHAQRLNPDLTFEVGSMTNLAIPDASVGGVCAWYSIIHIPDGHLDRVFDEFVRVLAPGGMALLAFQVGDQPRVLEEAFGQQIELTFFRRQPDDIIRRLERTGLRRYAELVREPANDGFESTPQAYLIAQKS
ncbi:class I SAM-dependent methyltransferase [Hoyosella altamirensis]|uniref:class I SAM-dependent methyltransferase n=1 Tax=Hoyosella altamirensis TaxID=616997 RepID=UPI0009459C86|nr:class I SAM-dependent methyltransferase [Hoyosella altamirensis]